MDRLKEPSTWAGVAGVAQAAKVLIPAPWSWIADVLSMLAGAAAMKLREGA